LYFFFKKKGGHPNKEKKRKKKATPHRKKNKKNKRRNQMNLLLPFKRKQILVVLVLISVLLNIFLGVMYLTKQPAIPIKSPSPGGAYNDRSGNARRRAKQDEQEEDPNGSFDNNEDYTGSGPQMAQNRMARNQMTRNQMVQNQKGSLTQVGQRTLQQDTQQTYK